jgi:hypothetical protein
MAVTSAGAIVANAPLRELLSRPPWDKQKPLEGQFVYIEVKSATVAP